MDLNKSVNNLPQSWLIVRLEEISKQIKDGSHNPPKRVDAGIPMLSARNIENGHITFEEVRYITLEDYEYENRRTKIEIGDVLLTIVATIGRSAFISESIYKRFTLQRSVAVVKPLINGKFLMYYFLSPSFQKQLNENAKGTAQKGVYLKTLRGLNIPLPSTQEQQRIVSKIEELLSELDHSEKVLRESQKKIALYRQSLLKSAFEGKLTVTWRGKHKSKKTKSKIHNNNSPDGWTTCRLVDASEFIGSGSTPRGGRNVYRDKGIPFIRSQNVHSNSFIQDDLVFISNEVNDRMKRSKTKPRDVLLNITGASIGRSAYIPDNFFNGNVNQHVCIIRLIPELVYYKYLTFYLNSPSSQLVIKIINSGATREALNLGQINNITIPLCSYDEQVQIALELESRFTLIDNLEKSINKVVQSLEATRVSILKEAFIGNLVYQDSNEESPSLLMKRIKKEKELYLEHEKQNHMEGSMNKSKESRKKKDLIEIIKKNFSDKEFSFEDIRALSDKSYDDLKTQIYALLDTKNDLEIVFNKSLESIFYKLKS